jgi:RHS repeat-associated protein
MFMYDDDGFLTGVGAFTVTRNMANGLPEAIISTDLDLSRYFNGYGEIDGTGFTVSSQGLTSWDLTRNNAGRIVTKTETVDGVTSEYLYGYDSMGRLLTVLENGILIEEYEYGPNGNRIYEMNNRRGITGRSLVYSDEDHLLTAGTTTYQYDPDGFLTTKTDGSDVTAYDYSLRGELLRVTLPDGRLIAYIYDPLGRRIAKKIDGVVVKKYLWQGFSKLLAVYDKSDNLLMRFEYADGRQPLAMTKGGLRYYLTYDQVGSLRVVADASGAVVKKIKYDAFGNILNDTNQSFDIPFGFAGGLHDRDTGLVHFGFRDYNPDVGRWTAKDPIFFAGGSTDLYGYCLNDPVNIVDPLGLKDENPNAAWTNLFPGLPTWSEAFPESDYVAPIVDITVGGLEAGAAVACGITTGVSFLAGPEFWWLTVVTAPAAVQSGWDAVYRINTGIGRLGGN